MVSIDICFFRASVRGSEFWGGLLNFCCLLVTSFEVRVLQEGAFERLTCGYCSGVVIMSGWEGAFGPAFFPTFCTFRVRIDWDCCYLQLKGFGESSC